jgi:hypothetical protein
MRRGVCSECGERRPLVEVVDELCRPCRRSLDECLDCGRLLRRDPLVEGIAYRPHVCRPRLRWVRRLPLDLWAGEVAGWRWTAAHAGDLGWLVAAGFAFGVLVLGWHR